MLNRMEALKIRDVVYALCREIFLDKLSDCYLYDITTSIKPQSKEILNKYKDVLPFYQNVLNEGVRYEG